jgi:hypothetical protein
VTSHLNRLVRFYPWSDDLPSTSPDFVTERAWLASGEIPVYSTVLVTVNDDKANSIIPFRIGRLITHPNSPAKENASDPVRMPMGLFTASGVFFKFIDEVLGGLECHIALTYIDDFPSSGLGIARNVTHTEDTSTLVAPSDYTSLTSVAGQLVAVPVYTAAHSYNIRDYGLDDFTLPPDDFVLPVQVVTEVGVVTLAISLFDSAGLMQQYELRSYSFFARAIEAHDAFLAPVMGQVVEQLLKRINADGLSAATLSYFSAVGVDQIKLVLAAEEANLARLTWRRACATFYRCWRFQHR